MNHNSKSPMRYIENTFIGQTMLTKTQNIEKKYTDIISISLCMIKTSVTDFQSDGRGLRIYLLQKSKMILF